jgi:hypothetical protein
MTTIKINKWILIIAIAVIVVQIFSVRGCINGNRKAAEQASLASASIDTIRTYKNKLGQSVSQVSVMATTNQNLFMDITTKDSTINHLKQVVKLQDKQRREVGVAMSIYEQTIYNLKDSLSNFVVGGTTEHHGDTIYKWPVYQKIISDKWIDEQIKLGKNTFSRNLVIRNQYDIVIGEEPDGWFKVKKFAEITNLNPNTETRDMKVYQKVSVPNKPLKVGIITLIVGVIGGLLIHNL